MLGRTSMSIEIYKDTVLEIKKKRFSGGITFKKNHNSRDLEIYSTGGYGVETITITATPASSAAIINK